MQREKIKFKTKIRNKRMKAKGNKRRVKHGVRIKTKIKTKIIKLDKYIIIK